MSTKLKHMPDGYDDVCDLASCGLLAAAGYHDGIALEEYANDNGIILPVAVSAAVGQTLTLRRDAGYALDMETAETDDISYGFVKILACEDNVLTVRFFFDVPSGLCDTVEGIVELRPDTGEPSKDIDSLINRIKRKHYSTMDVAADELKAIAQSAPFLPESYLTYLRDVGYTDMDFLMIGWRNDAPTNLDAEQTSAVGELLKSFTDAEYSADDFYFFGMDSDDGYYAFSKRPDDAKVYLFSNGGTSPVIYDSFEELLSELIAL